MGQSGGNPIDCSSLEPFREHTICPHSGQMTELLCNQFQHSPTTPAPLTPYPSKSTFRVAGESMGRTIPSWRIVVDEELTRMARFKQFLRAEDRVVFDDLIAQCRLYSSSAGVLASSIREVPLLLSMVFAQHKKLMELEKRMNQSCP